VQGIWLFLQGTPAAACRCFSSFLCSLSSEERQQILLRVAEALVVNEERINAENEADVEAAQLNGIAKSLVGRLTIKPGKIASFANSLRVLSEMKDPIGAVTKRTEIADGLILEKTTCPLGVVLVIFESRPDALVQVIFQICGFLHALHSFNSNYCCHFF
jgi:delta-1-pyrroline-5-carboxylate synthetase